jgi:hypothetical protein
MPFAKPEDGKPFANRPSDKFCVMNREFYNDLKYEIARIQTAVNVEQASEIAKSLLGILEEKFENKGAFSKLAKLDGRHPIIADPRNAQALINPQDIGE